MKGIIAWFVDNRVAANLLMWVLVLGGAATLPTIRQEEFPSIDTEIIQVSVPYPGATPEEVEEAICVRVEEAIEGTAGIDVISASASEGACSVTIELVEGVAVGTVLDEVKSKIEGIDTFPEEAERPVVSYLTIRGGVLEIAVSGDVGERTLKLIAQGLRDEISDLPEVSQVELGFARGFEISIEVAEDTLRRHGLTLAQIADAIRRSSLDLPAGALKTAGGQILLRTRGQAYRGADFEDVVILTRTDGTSVTLGEVARVVDGFEDADLQATFDGRPAIFLKVYRVGDEDVLDIAARVNAFVVEARNRMPPGVDLTVWRDSSKAVRSRIDTLMTNAQMGFVLVIFVLALALRFRLALWVAAGIPISLLGAIMLFPSLTITISGITVMGFVLVLGIVVDDAIVVGERVYAHERNAESQRHAAIEGTYEVTVPVIFGVLTTVAAFSPLVLVPGRMGQIFGVMGMTVILCLLMSLLECIVILPSHLAHRKTRAPGEHAPGLTGRWTELQDRFANGLEHFAADVFRPALDRALEWRYLVLAIGIGSLILTAGLFQSGRMVFQFFPSVEGDRVHAKVTLPSGAPFSQTEQAVAQIEDAARALRAELDEGRDTSEPSGIRHVLASIGASAGRSGGGPRMGGSATGANIGEVVIELAPYSERGIRSEEIAARWRDLAGSIPDAVELSFSAASYHAGEPINFQLSGRDIDELRSAATAVGDVLATYAGVYDITDSFRAGKQEVQLSLRPEARTLGLTQIDLARQVRQAFYGEEVQRIQRGQDDVRVMVRFPQAERRSLGDMEDMRIRTPDGSEVAFASVASATLGRGYASIRRTDGRRVVSVSAGVDRSVTTPEDVVRGVRARYLPQILAEHPGVDFSLRGEQRERTRAFGGLLRGFGFALLVIYALLAIPLRSYSQPLIIMSAIPFGIVGAILGHLVLDRDLVFFSLLGIVALSGVVVNDSLILVHYVNGRLAAGIPLLEAVSNAGAVRFRPILLTSATTFVGLVPLFFSNSPATFFMVPIAISLAFGILLATVITLFLVPCLYVALDDVGHLGKRARTPDPAGRREGVGATG